jgi:GTP pyrophosphokinase
LAAIGASKVVIAAGLLHDTIDESSIKFTQLESQFGSEVATLVNGVLMLFIVSF